MASALSERRVLRRIPVLRSLPSRELEAVQQRMIYHTYRAGEMIWRTHGPLRFTGYLQRGEIEVEYRVDGVPVRTTRLYAGDPLPPRALQNRLSHGVFIARAVTDVRIGILPEQKRALAAANVPSRRWLDRLWPIALLMLVIVLAWDDLARLSSGSLYLASTQSQFIQPSDPRSMLLLQAAQKLDRGAAFTFNELGYRHFQQNDVPEAAAAFKQALDRDPANAPALNNLGILYFLDGKLKQAARTLVQTTQYEPDNPTVRYNLGITLMQLDDPAGAIRQFRETSFIDPEAVPPLLQQAYLYQQIGDYANAEQRARSAIRLNPTLVPAHLLLGMALYNQGQEAEALAAFAKTLALEPGNRTAAFYQALILGHIKQYDAALPKLERLLDTSTDAREAARIQAEIDALYRFQSEAAAGN